jgi:hypothetical protein
VIVYICCGDIILNSILGHRPNIDHVIPPNIVDVTNKEQCNRINYNVIYKIIDVRPLTFES